MRGEARQSRFMMIASLEVHRTRLRTPRNNLLASEERSSMTRLQQTKAKEKIARSQEAAEG